MACGIYCIENKLNGKRYIGQGISVEKRVIQSHRECRIINDAIKKYKKENFLRYIVLYCNEWELERYEKECIKIFNSHVSEKGYNISFGGKSTMLGLHHSNETKEKMRKNQPSAIGEKNHFYGKHHSEESRKEMSKKRIGKKHSEEEKKKIGDSQIGINHHSFGKKQANSSSVYYGVWIHKTGKYFRWESFIRENKKQICIGRFKTEVDAALAYDKYVIEHNLPNPLNFSQ